MESEKISNDVLLRELGGCGCFQILFCILAYLPWIPWAFSSLFMIYGAYNPGWRCLDNLNSSALNRTESFNQSSLKYNQTRNYNRFSCEGFETCQNVEFNPEASTIVTEWGLICDKAWPVPLILTLQGVGGLVGAFLLGYLGDRFGRKVTLYSHLTLNFVCFMVSMFSVSWKMFLVLQFLIRINCTIIGFLPIVYIAEFIPSKWRIVVANIPVWCAGTILFSVTAMLVRNWRQMYLITALISIACVAPVIWVPESLRWLALNKKKKKYLNVGQKIAKLNKSSLNTQHCLALIREVSEKKSKENSYGIPDLFRKGYRMSAVIAGLLFMSLNIFYFVAFFGLSYLPGNLYVNLIISSASEIPANIFAAIVPNIFGRKTTTMIALIIRTLCLFGIVGVDLLATGNVKDTGTVALIVIAKMVAAIEWYVLIVYIIELYPTVVRSTASGYGSLMGLVGIVLAPYVIPTDADTFYINYLAIAVMTAICTCLIPLLPETKGKPLSDTWEVLESHDTNQKI